MMTLFFFVDTIILVILFRGIKYPTNYSIVLNSCFDHDRLGPYCLSFLILAFFMYELWYLLQEEARSKLCALEAWHQNDREQFCICSTPEICRIKKSGIVLYFAKFYWFINSYEKQVNNCSLAYHLTCDKYMLLTCSLADIILCRNSANMTNKLPNT